jgi:hypothetical protein
LPDPRLVGKPDLYRLAACPVGDRRQTGSELLWDGPPLPGAVKWDRSPWQR